MLLKHEREKVRKDDDGHTIMTNENLINICLEENLYEFPKLNSKLYLGFRSITKIQNLNEFVNLSTLYMENNVI